MSDGVGSEEVWDVLGAIRLAIEEDLPPGLISSVDEIETTVSAEVEAITAAITKLGEMLPSSGLV